MFKFQFFSAENESSLGTIDHLSLFHGLRHLGSHNINIAAILREEIYVAFNCIPKGILKSRPLTMKGNVRITQKY
jgi:hypothetical protein